MDALVFDDIMATQMIEGANPGNGRGLTLWWLVAAPAEVIDAEMRRNLAIGAEHLFPRHDIEMIIQDILEQFVPIGPLNLCHTPHPDRNLTKPGTFPWWECFRFELGRWHRSPAVG